jgi:arginine decarboxylase
MDQHQTPLVDALATAERRPVTGFGAPGHSAGKAMPTGMRRLLGKRVFLADVLTPKGLDDRTEGLLALQRAHELAADAWGADFCRFVTGGSTQSLHTILAAVARPGDTVLIAANAHKAERNYALAAGLDLVPLPAAVDTDWDIEHGPTPATLEAALAAHPAATAVLVVSPSYYGVSLDVAGLAAVAHAHGVPLLVDAAWGGAFAFSPRLPADALAQGADIAVYSLHKTMGALAQGSAILARGDRVDRQRLWQAYEMFETTSPSVPILATLDATRHDHATGGAALWARVLDLAASLRTKLAQIHGLRIFDRANLPAEMDLDASKVLIDISAWGVSGYAVDDWLYKHHRIGVGLSDGRHLLVILSLGSTDRDVRKLVRAIKDLANRLKADPAILPAVDPLPAIASLDIEMAIDPSDALFGSVEQVRYEAAVGRIAAETIAPAPPGVPRLVPGQRISERHVRWLVANRDAGAFMLDPIDPTERTIRVVVEAAAAPVSAELSQDARFGG